MKLVKGKKINKLNNSKIYEIVSYDTKSITLSENSQDEKLEFKIGWERFFLVIEKLKQEDLYQLGKWYYSKINEIKISIPPRHDKEMANLKKAILSEIHNDNFIILDVPTNKMETLSKKFLEENIAELINNFTSLQAFFLGFRYNQGSHA